jgi:protein-L-isoaspartate(D-aspartate) O-methyltransferase
MVKDQILDRGIKDQRLIQAMEQIPRHLFVEEALAGTAYGDFSLPIGQGQTISRPSVVALMTEALELKSDEKVLEIGTGSGYQTAVLAMLCYQVFSIERIRYFAIKARRLLSHLGFYNVIVKHCDGSQGWPEKQYFDGIMVTASAPFVPHPLIDQLVEGGRIVIPIGSNGDQKLLLLRKEGERIIQKQIADCKFVKLIGNYGWKD